jgi:hypothetical protein
MVGVNVTLKATLWPRANTKGTFRSLNRKLGLLTVACQITKAVLPEFAIVPLAVWLLPTGTFPKAKLAGLVAS